MLVFKMFKPSFVIICALMIIQRSVVLKSVTIEPLTAEATSKNFSYSQSHARIISANTPNPTEPSDKPNIIKTYLSGNEDIAIDNVIHSLYFLNSRPVVILLDDTPAAHRSAAYYMKYILNVTDLNVQFLLMKFNSTGVSDILADSATEKTFLQYLDWTDLLELTTQEIAPESLNGAVFFFAILRACSELPAVSGILIFTDSKINDKDLSQLALKELVEKDVKLFVVWSGVYPTINNEEKLMIDTTFLTGGNFYTSPSDRVSELYSKFYIQQPEANLSMAVVAFSTNIKAHNFLTFPIDPSVTRIHISVTLPISKLQLTTPRNNRINILNNKEVESFSKGSFLIFEKYLQQYHILLNTKTDLSSTVGIWRLDVDPGPDAQNAQGSNVTVSVQSHLNVTSTVTYKFNTVTDENPVKVLRVSVAGKNNSMHNIAILDSFGTHIAHVSHAVKKKKISETSAELVEEDQIIHEIEIPVQELPKDKFHLKIIGEDKKGNVTFSRVTYFDAQKLTYLVKPLTIEVSAGSQLITKSRSQGVIYFEVTNNRDQVMFVHFLVQDEKRMLRSLQPRSSWINPSQTIVVQVVTLSPNLVSSGVRNLITFTATGPEQVRKQAAMYVTNTAVRDNQPPRLTHKYTSDCTNYLIGKCQDGTWIIEVTAEDRESGLLTISSIPKGLYFPNPFIAGTKEPVIGIFGGSCCQPKIQLIAVDVFNNRRSYTADAYWASLSAGSISAIVLGVALLIIIICLIIFAIVRCRSRKDSMEVSRYSVNRETSTRL